MFPPDNPHLIIRSIIDAKAALAALIGPAAAEQQLDYYTEGTDQDDQRLARLLWQAVRNLEAGGRMPEMDPVAHAAAIGAGCAPVTAIPAPALFAAQQEQPA